MNDFLKTMAASSAERAAAVRGRFTDADLDAPVAELDVRDFGIIAEIKDASPSEGALASAGADRVARAREYARGGAVAISVLTEPSKFAGDMDHLRQVVAAVAGEHVPVMRKDFLAETVQVLEARAAGASGILLIAAMLTDEKLQAMLACAYEHSMFVLLEAFDGDDLRRCRELLEVSRHRDQAERKKLLVGVNTRNLRTLAVDPQRLAKLAPCLPSGSVNVAESGISNAKDAGVAGALGYRMALVGTALMRSADPAKLIAAMRHAGRRNLRVLAC